MRTLDFSPPDITEDEIDEVIDTLKSGWITTGPKTKKLEYMVSEYTEAKKCLCLNSATIAMEMVLRLFDIGQGDEVITTPYTYSATAAAILHTGATPVFVDIEEDSFNINTLDIANKITSKTKAIIPVDIGGYPCEYDDIFEIVKKNKKFSPKKNTLQETLGRILVLSDAAHSLGGKYKGRPIGSIADFTVFSFHAVKNITTAEGGAVTFSILDTQRIYNNLKTLSLHGQSKDALAKSQLGSWEYDILQIGYKCNMTDISASLGIVQLRRYKDFLIDRRKEIFIMYTQKLNPQKFIIPSFLDGDTIGSCHLFMLRIKDFSEEKRNKFIINAGNLGIPLNVHYKPLPMFTAYKNLGYKIKNFPRAYSSYINEVTLPLHTLLSNEDVDYICSSLNKIIS